MSDATEGKARIYLVEGKIKVKAVAGEFAEIEAYGSGETPYRVSYNGVWSCSCPAQIARCAHVIAAQLVTDMHTEGAVKLGPSDEELDAMLPRRRGEEFDPSEAYDIP